MLSIIVAKSINNAIGKDNKLLWKIPDDMKRFKEITTGHTVIMGRKTFESIGKVLPNRLNIILTRDPNYKIDDPNVKILGGVSDLEEYINDENENFVIGGAQIYSILMPKCQKLYVTQVDKDFVGDTYFPVIRENEWEVSEKTDGPKDENDFKYEYITYKRKGNN
jgi:dihydrofolate reductase